MYIRTILLAILLGVSSTRLRAELGNDSLPRLRHDISVGIGWPGLASINVEWGAPDPFFVDEQKTYQTCPPLYGQYLYNLNRHIGLGAMICYMHYNKDIHTDYYDYVRPPNQPYATEPERVKISHSDSHTTTRLFSIGSVFRVYWFNRKRWAMYSKLGLGMILKSRTEHKAYVMLDVNAAPVAIEFGSTQWRGFIELSLGTSYVCGAGAKYRF